MKRLNWALGSWALAFATSASALPDRTVSFDLGVGVPELLSLHAQVQAMPRLQVGLGYSYIPQSLIPPDLIRVGGGQINLADGKSYLLNPTVSPSALYFTPFVRYYPSSGNFYFQLSYSFFRMTGHLLSGLREVGSSTDLAGALVTSDVVITQHLPTLGIGHVFSGKVYFFNVFIGAAWLGSVSTSVTVQSNLPPSVGGDIANQSAVEESKADLQRKTEARVAELRRDWPLLPSIFLSFGIFL